MIFSYSYSEMFAAENEASVVALEKQKQSLRVDELREKQAELAKQLDELEKRLTNASPHHEE